MVAGGQRWSCGETALFLCFRIFLLAALPAGVLPWPSVQLEATATVRRGLATDVNPIITGLDEEPQLTHCAVRQVPQSTHLSCGSLRPSSLRCDALGPLVYQHYGCSSTRDLLHLQLLATRNGSTGEEQYLHFLSVEIVVEDYNGRLVHLETTTWPSEGYTYTQLTPVFPPEWIGKCYYRIVQSLLPTAVVQGMVNSPLPCGYVPQDPFLLLEDAHQNRSVLIEVTGTVPTMPESLRVLLFANLTAAEEPQALPNSSLQVLQFSHTPVSLDTLPCPHSSHQCIYIFPVLSAGAFISAYTPSSPQSNITKFTSEEIAAGNVVFVPNESLFALLPIITSSTYDYAVFDYANHMLAQSAVEVTVFNVDWNYPSLRFITSPRVESGGRVALNNGHLQLYIEPDSHCEENTFVALSRNPNYGTWTLSGSEVEGRNLAIGEPFHHSLLQNGTLVYQHDSRRSTVSDATIWNITCSGRTFQLGMTLLIIPKTGDWYPLLKVQPSTLITFCRRASPLLLDSPLYSNSSFHFDVNATRGAVVRLNRDLDTLLGDPFPPYMASDRLVPRETVTHFSIDELQRGLIWYIPDCSVTNWLEVSIHKAQQVETSLHSPIRVLVLYSTVPLEEFFLLSSAREFLQMVKNQPLPVASAENAVYITATFLYTRSSFGSPSAISYRVLQPPQYGHICFALESDLCTQSLPQFTQADLDRFKIVYIPDSDQHQLFLQNNDSFSFEVVYRNVGLAQRLTGVFHIVSVWVKPLVTSEEQLWVESGGSVTIPPDFFRNSAIKPLRSARFHLLALPQFGELVMPNGSPQTTIATSSYTFEELRRDRPQYRHSGQIETCSDSFTFSASNATHRVNEKVTIAIRQRKEELLGLWEVTKSVLAQENFVFTSQDFRVLSDFCLEFVQFMMKAEPIKGRLRLFQPLLHTFVQLRNNSVFSAEDVMNGRLWYMASEQHLNFSLTTDERTSDPQTMKIYLSDPKNFREPSEQFNSKISIDYEVTFLQPTREIHIHTVFNTRDVYVLSWIPELETFGYVFQRDDIRVDSTPDLSETDISVKILIKESPGKGWIERREQPLSDGRERLGQRVSEFYLEEAQEGLIYYVPNTWWIWVTSSDSFTMSILLETSNASFFINTVYNHSMALVWSWVNPVSSSYRLSESASTFEILFRRHVDNGTCPWYESNFTLALSPTSNATLTTSNCEIPSDGENDVCIESLDLSFPPGQCETSVMVRTRQDFVLEGPEQLLLHVVNCSNCVSNVSLAQPMEIIIDDTLDYTYVDVTTGAIPPVAFGCSRGVNMREQEGELVLELTRSGNLDSEVTVFCITQHDTALENIDYEGMNQSVMFGPGETRGRCRVQIYDDSEYEARERFYVYVRGRPGELISSTLENIPLCVYIVYDPNDAPTVEFQREPLVLNERDSASFSIVRRGFNLNLRTNACYQILPNRTLTNATLTDDFLVVSGCVESHDHHWCVDFPPNQMEVRCTVFAKPDNLLEGTESVFLQLLSGLRYGTLGQQTLLNITILDRTEPAHIGLASTEFHIDEREGLHRFPINRSGSINGVNKILCKLKPLEAMTQITGEETADFIVPRTPETVTFQPFNTTEYCSMWLRDDDVYEGVERLNLVLELSPQDPRVQIVPNRKKATIYIHDSQDEPKVRFAVTSYTVQEPISNFDVDQRYAILSLQRSGDTSSPSAVAYTTLEGSAKPEEHYVPINATCLFEPGDETRNITIPILASEDSRQVSFTVRLLTTPPGSAPPPVVVSGRDEATVVVLNTPVAGVLFPDRPVVVSLLPNGTFATGSPVYFNAPVVCIDPCDEDFLAVDEEALSYAMYCRDQQIDSSLTKYTWFISSSPSSSLSDRVLDYQPVEQATIFTSFDGKVLEPVYLNQSTYVRCSAQAITRLGTRGGTRHSEGVYLSRSVLSLTEDTCDSVSSFFELHEDDGFTGHPEELLRLTVVLKHHNNYIPLVSSRPFDLSNRDHFLSLLTRPFSRDQHSCSSLVESGPHKASFLSPLLLASSSNLQLMPPNTQIRATKSQLLYQHFNASKCHWEFHTWLPLSLLTDSAVCNGQLSDEDQTLTLTLPLYYAYIHLQRDRGVSVLPSDSPGSDIVRASWPSGHHLSIPFNTYPHTPSGGVDNTSSTYIYPITTRLSRGQLTITFYSVSNTTSPVVRVEVKSSRAALPGQLLYSSASSFSHSSPAAAEVVRQAWMLSGIPRDDEGSLSLNLWLHQCHSSGSVAGGSCVSASPLSFSWSVATTDSLEPRVAPQMNGVVHLAGGLIGGSIWLRKYFRLRANHSLSLERATLYLCADSTDNTSCTYSQIWELANQDKKVVVAEGFDMKTVVMNSTATQFIIRSKPLQELDITGRFQLHLKCSIRNTSDDPNTASHPVPSLVLSFHLNPEKEGLSSQGSSGVSHGMALLASSITVFLTAAALVTVVLVIVVALHWRWVRHKEQARSRVGEGAGTGRGGEQSCGSAEQNSSSAAVGTGVVRLRKSSSTTSFPTAEKLKTSAQQQEQQPEIPDDVMQGTTSQMTGQIDRHPVISKSLPNLFLASTREGKLGRKRQLRKNVRVQAIYSLQASLDKRLGKGRARVGRVGGKEGGEKVAGDVGKAKERGEEWQQDGLQVYVVKNKAAVLVRVQPLTGEVDVSRHSTASDLKPEDSELATEL